MSKLLNVIISICLIVFMNITVSAYDIEDLLEKGPVLSINRTPEHVFESVMSVAVINAPFDTVWDTIIDINNYKNYMDRVLKSKITNVNEDGTVITAEFEIDAPFFNMDYSLKHVLHKKEKKIEVYQVKGDLEGSEWKWEFKPDNDRTKVYYSGKTVNFSSILQKFDDDSKTVAMGINIASVLETLNNIKIRSEKKYKEIK